MDREDVGRLALAVSLTAVAGCVDAIGFLRLGHLFVSFMSGDSTQSAVAVSRQRWDEAGHSAGIVALFVLGVIGGRVLSRAAGVWSRPVVLATEAALLIIAVLIAPSTMMVVVMVLTMGAQNAVVHRAGHAKMSLTYVTGTLVSFGESLVDAFGASRDEERWAWVPYLLLWLGLMAGAIVGASTYAAFGVRALLIPALSAAVLAGISVA